MWLFFSAFLLLCAAGLMGSHVRTWRLVQAREKQLEPNELDYRRRQFRRRMQSTAMLALLAVALLVGYWVKSPPLPPLAFAIYWGGTLLVVLWVGLLGLVDMVATKRYFGQLRHSYLIEEAKLQAELRRIQDKRRNGKAKRVSNSGEASDEG